MTLEDIRYIEERLGMVLPEFYVSTMLDYPFLEGSWGADFSLCTDPKHIIDLNGVFTRSDGCFSIGSDGGEYYYFIKLNGEEKVFIFDLEGSDVHMSIVAYTWMEYLEQIEGLHDEFRRDRLLELKREENKKWWQFWI